MGGRNDGLLRSRVVEHFQLAVVHIDGGIPADMGPGHKFQHLARGHPQAWGQTGRPLENMVVGRHAVQGFQAAHGGTGNDGVLPVRQGAVIFIDIRFEGIDHPVHHHVSLAPDLAMLGIFIGHGSVLNQAAVALVVALHGHNDQVLGILLQILGHAPGFTEGGILVKEYIVPVEHIHDGIPLVRVLVIVLRQPDIGPAGRVPGQLRQRHIPFINHCSFLL